MSHFFRLVHNENIKIYKRAGTWVMIGIMVLVVALVGIFTKFVLDPGGNADWKAQLSAENAQLTESVESTPMLEAQKRMMKERIALNEYRIENDVAPIERDSLWGYMVDATTFTGIAALFTIVIAAGMVASEFSWGTVKLLLIRPVSRTKILLAKYASTLMFALLMLLLLFSASFLFGTLFFGLGGAETPYLAYSNGQVVEQNMVTHIIQLFGFRSIDLVMMVTLAFMISTVFRSSSLAIGISLFLMFTGPQLVQLLSQYDWAKFILFANTDLQQYTTGTPLVEGMTMTFSIVMLLIYFALFAFLSLYIFKKRDVAA
ncbi:MULTISPECIES: ABC transporter permease [Mesobacillus]|uniref:ABC transporter permease n=1 Tax=Mesobacillus selenatarsenatis TaxID=388741 RepID=A0A846TMZ3_9BACI|nr:MULTISPECIES: ABC transporter permease [Mesobacillus]NKE07022.1 ABC transporter permease [Mesobacillus selenatarsenatis]